MNTKKIPFFLLLLSQTLFISMYAAKAAVWEAKNSWNQKYEKKYSKWIEKLDNDFLLNGKYGPIPTDCGHAVYVLRAIFAYENSLPFQFTTHSRAKKSQAMKDFDHKKKPREKLFAFFRYLRRKTSTRTLIYDSHPIDIRKLRPGLMFLNPRPTPYEIKKYKMPAAARSGHVYNLKSLSSNGFITYVSSTVPTIARSLQPRIDLTFAPYDKTGGFRAWSWPNIKKEKQPDYSLNQFSLAGWKKHNFEGADGLWEHWQKAVKRFFQKRKPTYEEILMAKFFNLKYYILARAKLVNRGWKAYRNQYKKGCMAKSDYDNWSTPSRDTKIQSELSDFFDAGKKYLNKGGSWQQYNDAAVKRYLNQKAFNIPVNINGKVQNFNFSQLWTVFMTKVVLEVSEPEHSPKVRWGLHSQGAWPCPKRKKNYKYYNDQSNNGGLWGIGNALWGRINTRLGI